MMTQPNKMICVPQFHTPDLVTTLSTAFIHSFFLWKFHKNPPCANSIWQWYTQLWDTCSFCKKKSAGQSGTSEETAESVCQSLKNHKVKLFVNST